MSESVGVTARERSPYQQFSLIHLLILTAYVSVFSVVFREILLLGSLGMQLIASLGALGLFIYCARANKAGKRRHLLCMGILFFASAILNYQQFALNRKWPESETSFFRDSYYGGLGGYCDLMFSLGIILICAWAALDGMYRKVKEPQPY